MPVFVCRCNHSHLAVSQKRYIVSMKEKVCVNRTATLLQINIVTGRNEVVAKVIFLHLSVILFTGGASVHAGLPPPGLPTPPPGTTYPLDYVPPPPGSRLQHTVYERPVRILLECILVELLKESTSKSSS